MFKKPSRHNREELALLKALLPCNMIILKKMVLDVELYG
jgi:hypothetical protein